MSFNYVTPWIIALSLVGCGGGGGGGGGGTISSTPSLSTNLPSTAFDDETIVITVNTRNFGTGVTTFNATSNSLTIAQGNTNNQFVVTGVSSTPGNHTITFSASDTSGANASLNSSIRIDAVPTGYWRVTSLIVEGEPFYDYSMYSVITRNGRVSNFAATLQDDGSYVYEKCMGSHSISSRTLTFESWCADSVDQYQVDEENYRIAGEVVLNGDAASGTYSVYESNGAFLGRADVELFRSNNYNDIGLAAPETAAGVYVGALYPNSNTILSISNLGGITSTSLDNSCIVEGSVAPVSVNLAEGNDYRDQGIFDGVPLSQIGCVDDAGDYLTGNRDIIAGEGILEIVNGSYFNFATDDDVLFIYMTASVNSYSGMPSRQPYLRVCTAQGNATPFANSAGFANLCAG